MTGSEEEHEKWAAKWPLHLEVLFPNHRFRSAIPDPNFGTKSEIAELLSDRAPKGKKNAAAGKLYAAERSPLWPQAYEQLPAYLERLERVLIRLLQQIDVLPSIPTDATKLDEFVVETFRRGHSSDKKYRSPLNVLAGVGLAQVMDLRQSMAEKSVDVEDAIRAGMQIGEIIHRLISSYHAMPAHRQRSMQAAKKETKEDRFIRLWLNQGNLSLKDVGPKGLFKKQLLDDFKRAFPSAPKGKFSQCLRRMNKLRK